MVLTEGKESDTHWIMCETIIIQTDPKDILISPEQVARYAGGSRYRPDDEMATLIETALETAMARIAPAFAYALHEVDPPSNAEADGGGPIHRAAAVCTLGPDLEAEAKQLGAAGDPVAALFLDAAGTAMLEALAGRARSHLADAAREAGLYAGNRYGPGYCGMAMTDQPLLFGQVDAARIGVRLTESGMMIPVKSLSFWVDWQTAPSAASETYKCRRCTLKECAYRMHSDPGAIPSASSHG